MVWSQRVRGGLGGRRAAVVVALAVAVAMAAVLLIRRGGPEFSSAAAAGRLGLGAQGGSIDFRYGKCPGDLTPHLEVWEEVDGRFRPWAVFLGVVDDTAVYWSARREDGVTTDIGEDLSVLGPVGDARIKVLLRPHHAPAAEVSGLRLSDLPYTHGDSVLLANGRTIEQDEWRATVLSHC